MINASSLDDRRAYRRRVIAAVSIGNALEWFDFIACGFLAVTMAKLFFPTSDPFTSLLLTFATFGIPFLADRWALSWWVPMPIAEVARRRSC